MGQEIRTLGLGLNNKLCSHLMCVHFLTRSGLQLSDIFGSLADLCDRVWGCVEGTDLDRMEGEGSGSWMSPMSLGSSD